MTLTLSVLDLSPVASGSNASQALRNTIELAERADQLGYNRYWLAEHHNMPGVASTSPEIMISQVARATTGIRVGSGGIMLPNHTPLKVVEGFKMLEALFPERIDLGIGRAPGTDPWTAQALRRSQIVRPEEFPQQLEELFAFAGEGFPEGHKFQNVKAVPTDVPLPPVWMLGSSDFGASLAAKLGLGFAFAHHINAQDAVKAMRIYREQFQPSAHLSEPRALLTTSAVCAETDEEAEYLAESLSLMILRLRSGKPGLLPSPEEALAYPYQDFEREFINSYRSLYFVGSPAKVKQGLLDLVEQTGADEVMLTTNIHDHSKRIRSYELLAEAFGLQARTT